MVLNRTSPLDRVNYFDFRLTHITFNYGAFNLHLGLEQLKDRTIKLSTVSLTLRSTFILEFLYFQIKLRDLSV